MNQYLTGDYSKSNYKFRTEFEGETWTISSHRVFSPEKVDSATTKIMCHKEEKEGQKFRLIEKFAGLYILEYVEREYYMRNWTFAIKNNSFPCFSQNNKNLLKFYRVNGNSYLIQEATTNKYFQMDTNNKRDDFSYYLNFVDNKEQATIFKMEEKK